MGLLSAYYIAKIFCNYRQLRKAAELKVKEEIPEENLPISRLSKDEARLQETLLVKKEEFSAEDYRARLRREASSPEKAQYKRERYSPELNKPSAKRAKAEVPITEEGQGAGDSLSVEETKYVPVNII